MGVKLTNLPVILSSSITDSFVFPVGTTTESDQLSLTELQKSFTGLTARTTAGISIVGKTVASGITISNDGYVGVDKTSPTVTLDVGDIGTNGNGQVRLNASSASRKIAFSLQDSAVTWRQTKRASDTDFYIEVSQDSGTTVTGVLNIDVNGNVGIFNGSAALSDKFYVSGGNANFQSGGSGISIVPSLAEIKSTATDDIFAINKSNNNDITIGNNVLYIDNDASAPKVGINTSSPAYPLDVVGSGLMTRFRNSNSNTTSLGITNTVRTGYLTVGASAASLGADPFVSANNVNYRLDTNRLAVGTISPDNKLHVFSSADSRLAKLENTAGTTTDVFQVNNNSAAASVANTYSFGRYDGANNVGKWAVGLYDDGATNTYQDVFAFYIDADTSSEAKIKAYLDRNGNVEIKGGITTSGQYTQGKFMQIFKTHPSSIYFDPMGGEYAGSANTHTDARSPFAVMPYAGRIEKIQLFTSDDQATLDLISTPRIEIAVVTPTTPGTANETDFVDVDGSPSVGVDGLVGYKTFSPIQNQILTINRDGLTAGATNFAANQLLQLRICASDGSFTNANFTVMTCISFTIT